MKKPSTNRQFLQPISRHFSINTRPPTLRAVSVWLVAMGIMISYSIREVGWSFTGAILYCQDFEYREAWNSDDSSTWMFGVTGVFAMLGVPIMAVANNKSLDATKGDLEGYEGHCEQAVTAEELIMLQKFGLE
jgi:hypothetical protein